MSGFVLYDDTAARDFAPFALTRPAGELRAGAFLTRERWVRLLGSPATAFVSAPHLRDFVEEGAPPAASAHIPSGSWLVNARCAPAMASLALTPELGSIRVAGRVAAVKLSRDLPLADFGDGALDLATLASGHSVEVHGWWLEQVWDLVGLLPAMLLDDAIMLVPQDPQTHGITVLGEYAVHVEPGAKIEPFVVADTSGGPVVIRHGAHVMAFTRFVGPCVIGEESTVMGGRLATCSIGPQVKVSGEMSVTLMLGQANKGHDGFVGHSVIGRWANLGAGTITSNLKNSYGEVSMWTPKGVARTGQQFLGSLIGDHVKTGIGTRLSTGSVIGAAANLFGTRMPPKYVAPFAWGDGEPWETFALDRFLSVATRVMARRSVKMPTSGPAHWARVFALRTGA
jgi:UDP-N-acetylglucosamine diphosphorylase / glucose-1-phosphate thymidylyltransferase / UDP-N-acetylgalactosamine diphosphorylase / glucosamine-1-phosphate N-acetyltransferase / galactosamine-1-phosphate N-acetyltransferase